MRAAVSFDETDPHASAQRVSVLGLVALVPFIGAQFGYGNQIEQFSIIARLQDPLFAQGDFYVDSASGFGPRIYYAKVMAWIAGALPLAFIVHLLAFVCNFALGGLTYFAARQFFAASAFGAMIAALLAVTNAGFSLGLAGYLRFDSFQPANLAICFALSGTILLLLNRPFSSAILFSLAAMMHPLHGVEIALISYVGYGLAQIFTRPLADAFQPLATAIIASLAFLFAVACLWVYPTFGEKAETLSQREFFDILIAFRAPHHYLGLTFPTRSWLVAGLFVAATLILFGRHSRIRGLQREILALVMSSIFVLLLCGASLLFVDMWENRAAATAQVFRMLLIVKWVGFLLIGWFASQVISRYGWVGIGLVIPLVVVTADGHAIGIWLSLIATALLIASEKILPKRLVDVLAVGGVLALVAVAALVTQRFGNDEQTARAVTAMIVCLICFSISTGALSRTLTAVAFLAVVLSATIATRDTGFFGQESLRAQYVWSDLKEDRYDIARAAGTGSPPGAVWFVPPDLETFRLLSGRAVIVDYTSIPFEDHALREWFSRIDTLFGPVTGGGFIALSQMLENHSRSPNWIEARDTYQATHAVLFRETPWDGPILYENATYKAVALSSALKATE